MLLTQSIEGALVQTIHLINTPSAGLRYYRFLSINGCSANTFPHWSEAVGLLLRGEEEEQQEEEEKKKGGGQMAGMSAR